MEKENSFFGTHIPETAEYGGMHTLCGFAWVNNDDIVAQYYRRAYCGRANAAPEYCYVVIRTGLKSPDAQVPRAYPPSGVKRFTKRPCGCGCDKSEDKCD